MDYSNLTVRIGLSLCLTAGFGVIAHAAGIQSVSTASLTGVRAPAADDSGLSDEERIRETISLYGRATDAADVEAFRKIFTPDVLTENFRRNQDGSLTRSSMPVGHSVDVMTVGLAKVAEGRGGAKVHHFTHDPIIEIDGKTAHINVQFLVTRSRVNDVIKEGGEGAQGTVEMTLTGYYDDILKKVGGRWLIAEHRVIVDIPFTLPK